MDYIRLCRDLADKGTLIPVIQNDLTGIYKTLNKNKAAYASVFYFNDAQFKQFQQTGTVAGMTDVTTNKLCWDLDSEGHVEAARTDAVALVERLQNQGYTEENIRIFFSGNKGFEISVELDGERVTPAEAKNICMNFADGLTTTDAKIYNATRILRLPLTKHEKSGLYKYPLGIDDLKTLSIKEIKEVASQELDYNAIKNAWTPIKLSPLLKNLKNKTPVVKPIVEASTLNIQDVDWSKKPSDLSPAKWLLELGFFPAGSRSHAGMILASTYRNLGYDENKAYYLIKSAMEKQSILMGCDKFPKSEIWSNIIRQVYSPSWNGGTYSEKTDDLLQSLVASIPAKHIVKSKEDVITVEQVSTIFEDYAANIGKNRLEFGIKSLDAALEAQVGRVYAIGGSPGSGKTSLSLQLLNNTSKQSVSSMFFSFDMSLEDVYQKLIQKHYKISAKDVYTKMEDPSWREKFRQCLSENYGSVNFVRSAGMSIEEMKDRIIRTEQALGTDIKFILVDYLDLIRSDYNDPTQRSMYSVQGLKEIASALRKCVVFLGQPNKANQRMDEPAESYAAFKGSGALAELSNAMLWVSRPGANPRTFDNDKYYSLDCLKNRHGAMFSLDFAWDGVTGSIREMEAIEKMNLEELRVQKAQKKKDETLF